MKKFITNRQICSILYCIISGYGVIDLPKIIATNAGTGGWITLLIGTIVAAFATYVITYVQYAFEGKTFYEYSYKLIGKYLTYMLTFIYIIYFIIFFTLNIRLHCEIIRSTILDKTPIKYICLLVYIVVVYALLKGINSIARLCEIYGIINIIIMIIISTILILYGKVVNMRPFFVPSNIIVYLKALAKVIAPFLGMESILVVQLSKNINKGILKYTTMTTILIGILFIYTVESVISVGGLSLLVNSSAAIFIVLRGVDITYLELLRRLDGIFIVIWIMNLVCSSSIWGYGAAIFTNKIFKNIKYKYIVIITSIISFSLSQLSMTTKQMEISMEYMSYLGLIVALIVPSILFIITKVKKYDKKLS